MEDDDRPLILCEGWRFVPQSFALVHQFQILALLDCRVQVAVTDLPYFDDWKPVPGLLPQALDDRLKTLQPMPAGRKPDAVIRVAVPYDFSADPDVPTLVMATSEAGTVRPESVAGQEEIAVAAARSNARIHAPSRWSRDGLVAAGIDTDRISVIGHGIDPGIFLPPSDADRTAIRETLNWQDDFVLLSVGAMTGNKGIDLLFAGFAALLETAPQARLVLKGADALFQSRAMVQACLDDLPTAAKDRVAARLTYFGGNLPLGDMARLYQAADIYVSPYRGEGFNLPVLEAMACGLPVICTAGGATDDFTAPECALPVEAGFDPAARLLSPSLDDLIVQLRRSVEDEVWRLAARAAGPAHVRERHTWSHAAAGLLAALGLDSGETIAGKAAKVEPTGDLRLHIGGEAPKPGWKVFNIQPGAHVDFIGDCTDLSRFENGTVDEIYASHVLEHLGYLDEMPQALKEFRRVLKPGGRLLLSVPDLEVLCRLFLDERLDMENRFHVMRIMYGGQMDPHDYHKVGMTRDFMADYLTVAGFREIERVESFGLFEDTSALAIGGVAISLNMQAVK